MLKQVILISSLTILFFSCQPTETKTKSDNQDIFTVAFYNVENLFDTVHELNKVDEEFTPNSPKKWNTEKYNQKLQNIASVIDSIGGKTYPDIVGLIEVENRAVLEDLVAQPSIKDANYQIIHYESPDFRGIDNALLYNPESFEVLFQKAIPVNMPDTIKNITGVDITTRDILYVKGLVHKRDTLHLFVNHWTSMYYGEEETVPHRKYCAIVLKHEIDSIMAMNPNAQIVAGGDLNEDVFGPAVNGILNPDTLYDQSSSNRLYDLSYYLFTQKRKGTYNYRGVWGTLDHMIISGQLLNVNNSIYTTKDMAYTFDSPMVMNEYNNKNGKGIRPNRSYGGDNYYGGYSDHLAVYLQFHIKP